MYLRDTELLDLVTNHAMVRDFPPNEADHVAHNPYGENSPIQPASIDLHIGDIQVPVAARAPVAATSTDKYSLPAGHSTLVSTHECVKMPDDVGACAYPIAGRRQGPILMLNPGHVDPGYEGKLWFSFINVGRSPVEFRRGMRIATVLFWRTSQPVESNFQNRYGDTTGTGIPERMITELSGDTLMVGDRAKQVAEEVVGEFTTEIEKIRDAAKEHLLQSKFWATVLPLILVPLLGFLITWVNSQFGEASSQRSSITSMTATISKLDAQMSQVQKDVSSLPSIQSQLQLTQARQAIQDELAKLQARLDALEKKSATTKP